MGSQPRSGAFTSNCCSSEKNDDPYPYIYVNTDGSARELRASERKYLETTFRPTDSGRPYVKSRYEQKNGWGEIRGFLLRSALPAEVRMEERLPPIRARKRDARSGSCNSPRAMPRGLRMKTIARGGRGDDGLAQHQGPKPILGVDSIGPTQVVSSYKAESGSRYGLHAVVKLELLTLRFDMQPNCCLI